MSGDSPPCTHRISSSIIYMGTHHTYMYIHEQLGIHNADEGQPARNGCLLFVWFALHTFSMYYGHCVHTGSAGKT